MLSGVCGIDAGGGDFFCEFLRGSEGLLRFMKGERFSYSMMQSMGCFFFGRFFSSSVFFRFMGDGGSLCYCEALFLNMHTTRIKIITTPTDAIGNSTDQRGTTALGTLFGSIVIVGGTNGRNFAVRTSSNRNKLKRSERPCVTFECLKVTKNGFTSPNFHCDILPASLGGRLKCREAIIVIFLPTMLVVEFERDFLR